MQKFSRSKIADMADYPILFYVLNELNSMNFLWSHETRQYIPFVILAHVHRRGFWWPDINMVYCDGRIMELIGHPFCDTQTFLRRVTERLNELILWQERMYVLRRILLQNENTA